MTDRRKYACNAPTCRGSNVAIQHEDYGRYRAAVEPLRPKDRELVVARVEAQWTLTEGTQHFGFATPAAARMAITRALSRLKRQLETA